MVAMVTNMYNYACDINIILLYIVLKFISHFLPLIGDVCFQNTHTLRLLNIPQKILDIVTLYLLCLWEYIWYVYIIYIHIYIYIIYIYII